MYLMTEFQTLVKMVDGKIIHKKGFENAINLASYAEWEAFLEIYFGEVIVFKRESVYLIIKNMHNKFLSAKIDGSVLLDQDIPRGNEIFRDIDQGYAELFWNGESERFADAVQDLIDSNLPVLMHVGCGNFPIKNFLNIDYSCTAKNFSLEFPNQYFLMHTVGTKINIANSCVDYIFHEHFIEHLCQFDQICFLAESHRILKKGGVHRINAPELIANFTTFSDFSKGYEGVNKSDKWHGHIGYLTPTLIEELAEMIGYSKVIIKKRGQSQSPYAIVDRRPFEAGADDSNIFIELIK